MVRPNDKLMSQDEVYVQRMSIMARHVDLDMIDVLEIGPFDRPTFSPDPEHSFFLDYLTQEQLKSKGSLIGRDIESIPYIDYVASSNSLSKEVDRKFGLIVANHVIEHVPNVLEWFDELYQITDKSGHLFLSIPDRRYTFDYLRPETSLGDILRAYQQGRKKPDIWDIFDVRYLERPQIEGSLAWHHSLLEAVLQRGGLTSRKALDMAQEESKFDFVDVHSNVFTYGSFLSIINGLCELEICPFELLEIEDVRPGTLEFQALLCRNQAYDPERSKDFRNSYYSEKST